MFLVDYHIHPFAHGELEIEKNFNLQYLKKFIKKAVEKDINEIGFSDHDQFLNKIDWSIIKKIRNNSQIPVKIGVEFDYRPENVEKIKKSIKTLKPDYTIGSVHHIGKWAFDHPDYVKVYKSKDINHIYRKYFELILKAIKTELFNIVGHFDLIKLFGYRIEIDSLKKLIKPILREIKTYNMALEVNTNGLNKPIAEIYPSPVILEMAFEEKIPITFGSDAHYPERVGENIYKYTKLIKKIGYKNIAIFHKGNMKTRCI